jgi:hypothetical protein
MVEVAGAVTRGGAVREDEMTGITAERQVRTGEEPGEEPGERPKRGWFGGGRFGGRSGGRSGGGAPDLSQIKPLPVWFFAFEGVGGAAYDICRAWSFGWVVLVLLGGVNLLVGLTMLGRRRKLIRAMLKNSRTRTIAIALIVLRVGVHLVLGAIGEQVTSAAGHVVVAVAMAGITVGLLWFDQRVTFRTLGLSLDRTA